MQLTTKPELLLMPESPTLTEFSAILKAGTPLLDVRSPGEFARGAIPGAINLPILDDDQRHAIGIHYKQAGKTAAVNFGHQLISGEIKESRLKSWIDFFDRNPTGKIYCFRGGLRSNITKEWLSKEGVNTCIIKGGYKALRQHCISELERISLHSKLIIIGGKTGASKTQLVNNLKHSVDLEGIANHRGSAFGNRLSPQPTQINFEIQVAIDLLKAERSRNSAIFIEDESSSIGSLGLPRSLFNRMQNSPLALIEATLEDRVDKIFTDYIVSNYNDYYSSDSENSLALFSTFLTTSLERIKKRLGAENYEKIKKQMNSISTPPNTSDAMESHRQWITTLLTEYYDPMYEYQLEKKLYRIVFRGNSAEFDNWSQGVGRHTLISDDD